MDYIGPYRFARIDAPPRRIDRQFRVVSHGGAHGVAVWDDGLRAEPFTMRATVYGYNVLLARQYAALIKNLEGMGPVALTVGGVTESDVLYQVTRVNPLEIKRIVYGRGPGGPFYARAVFEITVQPLAV